MDLRYGVRRLSASLLAAAMASVPLAVFFFPVTVVKDVPASPSPVGVISCYTGKDYISFRPIWQLEGLPSDGTGLVFQALIALSLGLGMWALYPAFKPSR